jgi:hypothetical protein
VSLGRFLVGGQVKKTKPMELNNWLITSLGIGEGRIDSPLLSVAQWEEALVRSGFNTFEVTTDVLDGRASMMISTTNLQRETDLFVQDGEFISGIVKILRADTIVNGNTAHEIFASDLRAGLQSKGYEASFASWPSKDIDKGAIYVILDDGAKPYVHSYFLILSEKLVDREILQSARRPNPREIRRNNFHTHSNS